MTTPTRAPLVVVASIAALAVVFGLFAITIGAGIWTFIAFVFVVIVLCFIVAGLYRVFIEAWIKYAGMKYKQEDLRFAHAREMYKLQAQYEQRQITAPLVSATPDKKYTDPARPIALKLLSATIDDIVNYGPKSKQLMTQADAAPIGIIADDWSLAVAYLCSNYGMYTQTGKGTFTPKDKTISRVMADAAAVDLQAMTR
jgi:hypothetical protein